MKTLFQTLGIIIVLFILALRIAEVKSTQDGLWGAVDKGATPESSF